MSQTSILSPKNPMKIIYINIAEDEYRATIERVIHCKSSFVVRFGDYHILIEKKTPYQTFFGRFKFKYEYVTDDWCDDHLVERVHRILDEYLFLERKSIESQIKKEKVYREEFCKIENERNLNE